MILGFSLLTSTVLVRQDESLPFPKMVLGLHESRRSVFKLSLLCGLEAFDGGFVVQRLIAYCFHVQFRIDRSLIGTIFLFANLLVGLSALAARWLARRFGLLNTMILTHLPLNALLILVTLMPNVFWGRWDVTGPVQHLADRRADPAKPIRWSS